MTPFFLVNTIFSILHRYKKNINKAMPTIFTLFGLRFMFYSDDHEPVHVHICNAGREAKYNGFIR